MEAQKYILGQTYIFALIDNGIVECFETVYTENKSNMYAYFNCGFEVLMVDNNINTEYNHPFYIKDSYFNIRFINCCLYVFTSKEKMEEVFPVVINKNLTQMKIQSEALCKKYMKLADDYTSMENSLKSIKNHNFELTNPFDK